jgi:hypothetical protein
VDDLTTGRADAALPVVAFQLERLRLVIERRRSHTVPSGFHMEAGHDVEARKVGRPVAERGSLHLQMAA